MTSKEAGFSYIIMVLVLAATTAGVILTINGMLLERVKAVQRAARESTRKYLLHSATQLAQNPLALMRSRASELTGDLNNCISNGVCPASGTEVGFNLRTPGGTIVASGAGVLYDVEGRPCSAASCAIRLKSSFRHYGGNLPCNNASRVIQVRIILEQGPVAPGSVSFLPKMATNMGKPVATTFYSRLVSCAQVRDGS